MKRLKKVAASEGVEGTMKLLLIRATKTYFEKDLTPTIELGKLPGNKSVFFFGGMKSGNLRGEMARELMLQKMFPCEGYCKEPEKKASTK